MKIYAKPELEISAFAVEDIMATSGVVDAGSYQNDITTAAVAADVVTLLSKEAAKTPDVSSGAVFFWN